MLQTRDGKRTGLAAVRIAIQMVDEGLITKEEAIFRVDNRDTGFSRQPMHAPASWRRRSTTSQRRIKSGRTTPFAEALCFC